MSRTPERRRSYNYFSGTPANLQAVFSFCENRPSERPRDEKSGWSLEGSAGAAFPAIRLVRPPLETLERYSYEGFCVLRTQSDPVSIRIKPRIAHGVPPGFRVSAGVMETMS